MLSLALRFGADQFTGIGMCRLLEDLPTGTVFNDAATLHYVNPLADFLDHSQVMGDQQYRHTQVTTQVTQQRQYLCLGGDIDCGRGFVGNQQIGLVGQRHSNHDPLALPAGQLMGPGFELAFGVTDTDQFQQFKGALSGPINTHPFVQYQGFADLFFHYM